jgi:hypothetical protein
MAKKIKLEQAQDVPEFPTELDAQAEAQSQLNMPAQSPLVEAALPTLFERVGDFLAEKGWTISTYPEHDCITFHLRLKDGSVRVMLEITEGNGWSRLLMHTCLPTYVPLLRRPAVAEAIGRINYVNYFGNLEMDMADGEVRVRTVLESDGFLGEPMMDRVLRKGLDLADQYQAPLLAIAFGNAAPADVLESAKPPMATLQ